MEESERRGLRRPRQNNAETVGIAAGKGRGATQDDAAK